MKKFDFSKEFGNIDPKYIEEAEREWSEKKENRRPKGWSKTVEQNSSSSLCDCHLGFCYFF